MNRVGRPVKYKNNISRIETRRIQNRDNQRRCRIKKELYKELIQLSEKPKDFNTQYRNDLVNFSNKFDFDYFFTGTIDLNKIEREKLMELNQQINRDNQELEMERSFITERRIGIKSLKKYTEKYLQYVYKRDLFEHCFVFFELGENNKYHTHIMFKSNPGKINFQTTSKKSWLLGNSWSVPVNTDEDKRYVLDYCVKELKPVSSKISDQNKVDNWFIWGDFNKNKIHKLVENISETVSC